MTDFIADVPSATIGEDLSRDAAEGLEGGLESGEERRHVRSGREADEEEPRVAQHSDESVAPAPGKVELGEVDLGLMPRRRLEPDDGLRGWPWPDLPHEVADLGIAAGVPGRADLVEEADGGELGVVGQAGPDDLAVGIELGGPRWTGLVARWLVEVAVELSGSDPSADGPHVDAEAPGDVGLGEALGEVVSEQHVGFESDHGCSGWWSAQVGGCGPDGLADWRRPRSAREGPLPGHFHPSKTGNIQPSLTKGSVSTLLLYSIREVCKHAVPELATMP